MGEIADAMLDGTLCAGCGVALITEGEEPQDFPDYCKRCAKERSGNKNRRRKT